MYNTCSILVHVQLYNNTCVHVHMYMYMCLTGAAMNDLWNELQAHLHNRLPEEQTQWLHYNLERIGKVLLQV